MTKKTNNYVTLFGVAWMPFCLLTSGAEMNKLPAYSEAVE